MLKKRHKHISFNVFKYEKKEVVHFFINILIGLGIAVFFHIMEKKEYGGSLLDNYLDTLISIEASVIGDYENNSFLKKVFWNTDFINKNSLQKLSFVEIDRMTLEEWGGLDKPIVPRDKLAKLLVDISKNQPKIVVVDILFDVESCNSDELFAKTVEKAIQKFNTVFVFPVIIDPVYEKPLYPFFYKKLKEKYPNNIFISTPYFYISEYDNTTRFIKFYETYINERKEKDILWNTSLLVYLIGENKLKEAEEKKDKLLKKGYIKLDINHKKLVIDNKDVIYSRLRFPYPVVIDKKSNALTHRELPVFPDNITPDRIKDRIVILGVSDPIKQDYFKTPIGYMPGMYLIGNGYFTLENLQIHHEWFLIKILIEIFVIVIAAYLFLWMDSVPATIISMLMISILLPLSVFLFFKYNIFINLVFPIIGIIFHKDIAEFEEFLINGLWKKKQS